MPAEPHVLSLEGWKAGRGLERVSWVSDREGEQAVGGG